MYMVTYSKQAVKTLRQLQPGVAKRILKRMTSIANDPYAKHNSVTTLKGMENAFRLRSGDWRIVYEVNNDQLIIWVVKIAPRGKVYKR